MMLEMAAVLPSVWETYLYAVMFNPRIESRGAGDFVKFVAIFEKPGGGEVIGYVQGVVEENGAGLLGDILVVQEIHVPGGPFGLKMVAMSPRKMGIGSDLLVRFESEMAARGVGDLYGSLPDDKPEVIECLVKWYEKRGYQVVLDPAFVPNQSRFSGRISTTIHPS